MSHNQKICSKECRDEYYQGQARRVGNWFIFDRDDYRCIYCGKSSIEDGVTLNADHIYPHSKGGKNVAGNLVTSCKQCNLSKLHRTLSTDSEHRILLEVMKRNRDKGIADSMVIKMPNSQS